jgi:hypothetical protein
MEGAGWVPDYIERAMDFWQRAGQTGASVASTWGERSLQDPDWTLDKVTADLIEAWEDLTPLVGEGLELWLELVQQSLRTGRADG